MHAQTFLKCQGVANLHRGRCIGSLMGLAKSGLTKSIHQSYISSNHEPSGSVLSKPRFYMPSEWSTHSRTITIWPDFSSVLDGGLLRQARKEVSAISNAISQFEPVTMYTKPENVDKARETVEKNVTVTGLEANHLWVRDSGPVVVQDVNTGEAAAVSLNFNYWGGKLPREGDEFVAARISSDLNLPVHVAPFRAEGGGIEVDGEGTMLATESAIVNSNRNPGVSKAQLEQSFHKVLGVKKTIWLPGIKGLEMTDYHIDALARFVKPGAIILSKPPNTAARVVQKAFEEAQEILNRETDASGRRLQVFEVDEPDLSQVPESQLGETVTSYVNYLVVNGGIIMPRFGVERTDEQALELFHELFPGREIIQVYINALPNMGGGIHCATQQVPAIEPVSIDG